jgi:hypothetical protein
MALSKQNLGRLIAQEGLQDSDQGFILHVFSAVIRPERPAPKGQESLAQGLPWVSRNKRFALKGQELGTRCGANVRRAEVIVLLAAVQTYLEV